MEEIAAEKFDFDNKQKSTADKGNVKLRRISTENWQGLDVLL